MHESSTPDREQSTRTEVYPTGSGEPDRGQGARWGAVHPMGSSTPGQNGCNAYRSGVVPSPTSTTGAHCRLPFDACRSAGHEAPLRLVGQSAVRAGATPSVGYRRGSRCVRVRHRASGIGAGRGMCGCDASSGIGVGRGMCGCDGSWGIGVGRGACGCDASSGIGVGRGACGCVSRRLRPCRCRDGCRETRASGGPGRWPLRR